MNLGNIVIGTWSWGNEALGYGRNFNESEIEKIIFTAHDMGINYYDTAIDYKGSPELIGKYTSQLDGKNNIRVMTKILPYFWRYTDSQLEKLVYNHLKMLKQESIFLLQIHRPLPPIPSILWMKKLEILKKKGLVENIGVSNFSYNQLKKLYETAESEGIEIFSNQVLFNLLKRQIEFEGQLSQNRIQLFAYSPLANGLLADNKINKNNFETEFSKYRLLKKTLSFEHVEQVSILLDLLEKYRKKHKLKSIATIPLQWIIRKKATPIIGISQVKHLNVLKELPLYSLSTEEMYYLDRISNFWTNEN